MSHLSKVRIGIIGASGYTGGELVRMLSSHPKVELSLLIGERQAGKAMGEIFPHLSRLPLPHLVKLEDADWGAVDFVFCCLPHGMSQGVIAALPTHLKICDLSADFRLADPGLYQEWYGHHHQAPELQKEAVYGLTELFRDVLYEARLVANPGCYPTAAQLPLGPLLDARLIRTHPIIIDAKSGVSGAGRDARQGSLYCEVTEGIHAYGVASHRHTPEIEQGLSFFAGDGVRVTFTPHLMPMSRGILTTSYVQMTDGVEVIALYEHLTMTYDREPFVQVLPMGEVPATRHVRGSNLCAIGLVPDRIPGQAILISAIDNLVKGASGQAIQNMNLMLGFEETLGLQSLPLFP